MPFAFANDYGGLFNNGMAAQQADVNTYFHLAELARQQESEQRQAQQDAQAQQQNAAQWSFKLQQAGLDRDAQNRAANLEERRFDFARTQERLGDKNLKQKNSWERTKELMPLADEGTLEDASMEGLQEDHQSLLKAHREAARTAAEAGQKALAGAGEAVGREGMLKNYIAQEEEAKPYWFNPFRWGRSGYNAKIQDWQDELTPLSASLTPERRKLAASLPLDPESGQPMAPPPLAWMRGRSAVSAPLPMPADKAQLVAGARYATPRGLATWTGQKFVQ